MSFRKYLETPQNIPTRSRERELNAMQELERDYFEIERLKREVALIQRRDKRSVAEMQQYEQEPADRQRKTRIQRQADIKRRPEIIQRIIELEMKRGRSEFAEKLHRELELAEIQRQAEIQREAEGKRQAHVQRQIDMQRRTKEIADNQRAVRELAERQRHKKMGFDTLMSKEIDTSQAHDSGVSKNKLPDIVKQQSTGSGKRSSDFFRSPATSSSAAAAAQVPIPSASIVKSTLANTRLSSHLQPASVSMLTRIANHRAERVFTVDDVCDAIWNAAHHIYGDRDDLLHSDFLKFTLNPERDQLDVKKLAKIRTHASSNYSSNKSSSSLAHQILGIIIDMNYEKMNSSKNEDYIRDIEYLVATSKALQRYRF